MAAEEREIDRQLCAAASIGYVEGIAMALVVERARKDGGNSRGSTPLSCAATLGHAPLVTALLAAGADVHRVDCDGDTAVHLACRMGHRGCARALLDAGARTDVRNRGGKRPIDVVSAILRFAVVVGPQFTAHVLFVCACPLCVQVCAFSFANKSTVPALRAVLTAAGPWRRRRAAALACYGGVWPSWEEEE